MLSRDLELLATNDDDQLLLLLWKKKNVISLFNYKKSHPPSSTDEKNKTTFMFFSFSIFSFFLLCLACCSSISYSEMDRNCFCLFCFFFCLFWVYRTKSDSTLRRTQDIWWDGRCFWNERSSLPIITDPCSIYIECCNIDIEKKNWFMDLSLKYKKWKLFFCFCGNKPSWLEII